MKTVEQIKKMILDNQTSAAKINDRGSKEYKKLQKQNKFLYEIQLFLEFGPEEQNVQRDLNTLLDRKKRIDEGFETWKKFYVKPKMGRPFQAIYREEMDLATLEKQIANLQFVLSN